MHNAHRSHLFYRLIIDSSLFSGSFVLAAWIAKHRLDIPGFMKRIDSNDILFLGFCLLAWGVIGKSSGLYDEFRSRSFSQELLALLKTIILMSGFCVLYLFISKETVLSRFFVGLNMLLTLVSIGCSKILLRLHLGRLRAKGKNLRFILVIGTGRIAREFARSVRSMPHLGYQVVGFLDDEAPPELEVAYLGRVEKLDEILSQQPIDDVVVAVPRQVLRNMYEIIDVCSRYPVSLRLIPDFFDTVGPRFSVSTFAHFPILSLRAIPLERFFARLGKQAFDLAFTLVLFVLVFSWLWPLIALLIKLDSPGPVFFRQERWGEKNRRIRCFKFRTMVRESRDVDEEGQYLQAKRDDPRITRIGRWLRRTNLDELPQFINVLKREMSMIGPRPHPTPLNMESKERIDNYMLRHLMKPGITGWAQVNGYRGETQDTELMKKRVEYDIWYIENWTFWLDLQILAFTIWHMLKGDEQAY